MVKKATTKKAVKNLGGRPRRDPRLLRTERLVLRIHPDLMECLTGLSTEHGITRSLLVERAMVTFVNMAAGSPILDNMGRRLAGHDESDHMLGTPASFQNVWNRVLGKPNASPTGMPQTPRWVKPDPSDRSGNPEDDGV